VEGFVAWDVMEVAGLAVPVEFFLVERQSMPRICGLLGLNNERDKPNVFDLLYQQKLISSSKFVISLK
jgi:hypothetical protein